MVGIALRANGLTLGMQCHKGAIHKGRPQMREKEVWPVWTHVLILPVKGRILRTRGEGGQN